MLNELVSELVLLLFSCTSCAPNGRQSEKLPRLQAGINTSGTLASLLDVFYGVYLPAGKHVVYVAVSLRP